MSWLELAGGSPFGLDNLPFGAFVPKNGGDQRLGVRIGDAVVDIGALSRAAGHPEAGVLDLPTLNAFMARGPDAWARLRRDLTDWLGDPGNEGRCRPHLHPLDRVDLRLPFEVADYVDFYSSEYHAANVGRIFRPLSPELPANWRHLPIGYHGRAGTVVVSGTPVNRPSGQRKPADEPVPTFGPSRELDFEAEVGFVVGAPSEIGRPVGLGQWRSHVFGVCLLNDWSARDIQSWEYVPLGPFLGKSFLTSVSPWVVPLAALDSARLAMPERTAPLLGYLDDADEQWGLDLRLEVSLNGDTISRPPFSAMYWSPAQQLAHLTVNGASLRVGDLFASGTVSGPEADQWGSMLELGWRGAHPVTLSDGSSRVFLEDGDSLSITASAPGPAGATIGFGEVTGVIRST